MFAAPLHPVQRTLPRGGPPAPPFGNAKVELFQTRMAHSNEKIFIGRNALDDSPENGWRRPEKGAPERVSHAGRHKTGRRFGRFSEFFCDFCNAQTRTNGCFQGCHTCKITNIIYIYKCIGLPENKRCRFPYKPPARKPFRHYNIIQCLSII